MTANSEPARIFRAALSSDAPAIRSIIVQSKLSTPVVGDFEQVSHSRIGEFLMFVIEENAEVIGVLQWRNLGEEAEILDLAVHPNYRRQGSASFLLGSFIQYLSQSAAQKIFLEVRESNAAAVALYQKFGFQISGRRPNYYRDPEENALLMTLSVPA